MGSGQGSMWGPAGQPQLCLQTPRPSVRSRGPGTRVPCPTGTGVRGPEETIPPPRLKDKHLDPQVQPSLPPSLAASIPCPGGRPAPPSGAALSAHLSPGEAGVPSGQVKRATPQAPFIPTSTTSSSFSPSKGEFNQICAAEPRFSSSALLGASPLKEGLPRPCGPKSCLLSGTKASPSCHLPSMARSAERGPHSPLLSLAGLGVHLSPQLLLEPGVLSPSMDRRPDAGQRWLTAGRQPPRTLPGAPTLPALRFQVGVTPRWGLCRGQLSPILQRGSEKTVLDPGLGQTGPQR